MPPWRSQIISYPPALYRFFEDPHFFIHENRANAMLMQPFASDKRVKTTTGRNERNWNAGEKKKN